MAYEGVWRNWRSEEESRPFQIIIQINSNTEKSSGGLRELAARLTLLKRHQLKLVGKTREV